MTRTHVAIGSLVILFAVSAAAQTLPGREQMRSIPFASPATTSVQPKNHSRVVPVAQGDDLTNVLIQLAQASNDMAQRPIPTFDLPPPPHMGPMGPIPPRRPPLTRAHCEDSVNFEVAHIAFLKSKLRLQLKQRDAWQKMEEAAQPSIDKLHAACDRLPVEPGVQPSPSDVIDMMEIQLSARLEILKIVREPALALLDTLSPQQRAALQPSGLPPMGPRPPL